MRPGFREPLLTGKLLIKRIELGKKMFFHPCDGEEMRGPRDLRDKCIESRLRLSSMT